MISIILVCVLIKSYNEKLLHNLVPNSGSDALMQEKPAGLGAQLPLEWHRAVGTPDGRKPSAHVNVTLALYKVELYVALTFTLTDGLSQSIAIIISIILEA